jgi:hypothetical protein
MFHLEAVFRDEVPCLYCICISNLVVSTCKVQLCYSWTVPFFEISFVDNPECAFSNTWKYPFHSVGRPDNLLRPFFLKRTGWGDNYIDKEDGPSLSNTTNNNVDDNDDENYFLGLGLLFSWWLVQRVKSLMDRSTDNLMHPMLVILEDKVSWFSFLKVKKTVIII